MKHLLLFLCLITVAAAQPTLSVKGSLYEGSALFLRVSDLAGEAAPTATFAGETYSFLPAQSGQWELVLGIPTDLGGTRTLTVNAEEQSWKRTFQVQKRNYGHQSLSINPSTLASYDNPQNKADDQAILAALKGDDTERLFAGDFAYPVVAPQTTGFGLKRTYNGWKKGWHKGLDLAGWSYSQIWCTAGEIK